MSREVRMVSAMWEHPTDEDGNFIPLYDDYETDVQNYEAMIDEKGVQYADDYFGGKPNFNDYMHPGERTHLMLYETTSEGTPKTPCFATAEELARYCADSGVTTFASMTTTYDNWLAMINAGWAPSAAYSAETGLISGVEAVQPQINQWLGATLDSTPSHHVSPEKDT